MTTPARALLATLVLVLAGCAGTAPPPEPGQSRGVPPDLRGRRVILLPVQQNLGVRGDVDAEIRFTFTDRGREVEWIFEEEVEQVLARTPGMDTRTRGLPVSLFTSAEVERVGDPLYGQLRRMSALVEADVILIPIAATFEPNETIVNGQPRVRLTATLVEPRTGRVVWYGIEEGGDFEQSDPRALASAVEALAATVFWYLGD
jgi:hypothetical protein